MISKKTGGKRRIFVMIPTASKKGAVRIAYLRATLRNILSSARKFGHDVAVVVRDTSPDPNYARKNEELINRIRQEFKEFNIHYHPPGELSLIPSLLDEATKGEKRAYAKQVPEDGSYGKFRGELALATAFHAGKDALDAAYYHTDDDTAFLKKIYVKEPAKNPQFISKESRPRLAKNEEDVLGAFLERYEECIAEGKPGYQSRIRGITEGIVSHYSGFVHGRKPTLAQLLQRNDESFHIAFGWGSGRMLSFKAMAAAYRPYGKDEDWWHGRDLADELGVSQYSFYLPTRRDLFDHPFVYHFGAKGMVAPAADWSHEPVDSVTRRNWVKLVKRAAKLGAEENK